MDGRTEEMEYMRTMVVFEVVVLRQRLQASQFEVGGQERNAVRDWFGGKSQGPRTVWTRRRIFIHAAVEDDCVHNDDMTRQWKSCTWSV